MKHKLLIIFTCLLSFEAMASGSNHRPASLSISSLGASFLLQLSAQETKVVIYPNPAKDRIWIKGTGVAKIEMVSLLGAVVLKEELSDNSVSIAELQSGIYIIRVYDDSGTLMHSTKVTKQ